MNKTLLYIVYLAMFGFGCNANKKFIGLDAISGNNNSRKCYRSELEKLGICKILNERAYDFYLDSTRKCENFINSFNCVAEFKNMKIIESVDNPIFVPRKNEGAVLVFLERNAIFQYKSYILGTIKGYFESKKKYPDLLLNRMTTYSPEIDFLERGFSVNCIYTWKNDTYVLKSLLNYNGGYPIPPKYYNLMFNHFADVARRDSL